MSGLELAATIIAFIEIGVKVVSRLHEFSSRTAETPETFRTLVIQLPLLNIILQRIRAQAITGQVDKHVVQALQPVIEEATGRARLLATKLEKIIPGPNVSTLERGLKALRSMLADSAVKDALEKIDSCVNILVLHNTQATSEVSTTILNEIKQLAASAPRPVMHHEETTALLHEAARQGHVSSIRSMTRPPLNVEVDSPDECGRTPLHTAAIHGQKLAISRLSYLQANVNAEDDFGQTPLHAAIIANQMDAANVLVARGATLDIKDDHGKKPLDYATSGFLTRWQILFGLNVDTKDPRTGNTALIQAARQGELEVVQSLLGQGAGVDALNHNLSTALAEACVKGHVEIASVLLEHGANPNTVDSNNWSPFQLCILHNHGELVNLLLDTHRVDLEATSSGGHNTPLCEASTNLQWPIVELLLDRGANPNARHDSGRSALRTCVLCCGDEKVLARLIRLFIKCKVDINMVDRDGWFAARESVGHGKLQALELLLQHGASPNGTLDNEPWLTTVVKRDMDIKWLHTLIRYGVNLEATNWDGWTALREAVHWGNIDMIRGLLEAGADVHNRVRANCYHPEHDNVTILMAVGWHGEVHDGTRYRMVIDALLSRGARLEDEDSHKWTVLRIAVERGLEDLACLLLSRGADPRRMARDGQTPLERAKGPKQMEEFCAFVEAMDVVV